MEQKTLSTRSSVEEQYATNVKVVGSNPSGCTIMDKDK
jgi:hypothetical protein